jgi:hypothetical protein
VPVGADRFGAPGPVLTEQAARSHRLMAMVAVAKPTLVGRVIAAWPSFAFTASYELPTRQVRRRSVPAHSPGRKPQRTERDQLANPHPRRSCGWSARPSWVQGTGHQVLICSGVPGSGRWPTVPAMGVCLAAVRSPWRTSARSAEGA